MGKKTKLFNLLEQEFFGESDIANFADLSVRKLMLTIVIIIAAITILLSASESYNESGILWKSIASLLLLPFLIASIFTINLKRSIISVLLCIIPLFILWLAAFYIDGYNYWVLCIPIIALLAGTKIGLLITTIAFLFISAVCFIPDFGDNYQLGTSIRYLAVYLTISVFSNVFEYVKNKTHYQYVKELERIGQIDPLTELLNRRGFKQNLEMLCKQAIRDELPISFMMIDIDHFKLFNDTYGHPKGDICLLNCVEIFRECVRRPLDLIVRMGGEEFGIFLFNTDLSNSVRIAEKIRETIEKNDVEVSEGKFAKVTVSIGIVSADLKQRRSFNFDDMINESDRLLYGAKNLGRNKVLHSSI